MSGLFVGRGPIVGWIGGGIGGGLGGVRGLGERSQFWARGGTQTVDVAIEGVVRVGFGLPAGAAGVGIFAGTWGFRSGERGAAGGHGVGGGGVGEKGRAERG